MLGMQSEFSRHTLINLIANGVVPRAIVLAEEPYRLRRDRQAIPVTVAESLTGAAIASDISIITLSSTQDMDCLAKIQQLQPSVLLVACFASRLPTTWLDLPSIVAVNLHPSLLPRFRGPCPLFWQFRNAEPLTGTTLHLLAEKVDAGDIVAQKAMPLSPGSSFDAITESQAKLGAVLVAELLQRLSSGLPIVTKEQAHAAATYQSTPTRPDFVLEQDMDVRQAYGFMSGVQSWGHTFEFSTDSDQLLLRRALGYQTGATLGVPYEIAGEVIRIQLADGILTAEGCLGCWTSEDCK